MSYFKTGKKIDSITQRNKNILLLSEPITVEEVVKNIRLRESTAEIELDFLVREGYLRK